MNKSRKKPVIRERICHRCYQPFVGDENCPRCGNRNEHPVRLRKAHGNMRTIVDRGGLTDPFIDFERIIAGADDSIYDQ